MTTTYHRGARELNGTEEERNRKSIQEKGEKRGNDCSTFNRSISKGECNET